MDRPNDDDLSDSHGGPDEYEPDPLTRPIEEYLKTQFCPKCDRPIVLKSGKCTQCDYFKRCPSCHRMSVADEACFHCGWDASEEKR